MGGFWCAGGTHSLLLIPLVLNASLPHCWCGLASSHQGSTIQHRSAAAKPFRVSYIWAEIQIHFLILRGVSKTLTPEDKTCFRGDDGWCKPSPQAPFVWLPSPPVTSWISQPNPVCPWLLHPMVTSVCYPISQLSITSAENRSQEELCFPPTSCLAYSLGLKEHWTACFSRHKEKWIKWFFFRYLPSLQSPYWVLWVIFLKRIRIFGSCFPRTKNALDHNAKPTELCWIPALPFIILRP